MKKKTLMHSATESKAALRILNKIIFLLLVLGVVVLVKSPVSAQETVTVLDQEVAYSFGDQITFRLSYESEISVDSIILIIQAPGLPSFVGAVSIMPEGEGSFVYMASDRPLPAFSSISYAFQFTLANGELVSSPTYHFTYLDNRFNWQELIGEPFRIYWYQGEITLAQDVLDAALAGRAKTLELLQQPPDLQPIVIFIYSSEEDLQSTLAFIGQSWVSGYADPARGAIVVALPSAVDQPLEIQRMVPHEVAHILLYRYMGAEFEYLPAWLNEGIASQMEIYTLPEYDLVLDRAYEGRDLIPTVHLCEAFPPDGDLAFLAYAQSDSLVEYIQNKYGLPGLQALIYAYDQGVSCEQGVEMALGITLQELEKDWTLERFNRGRFQVLINVLSAVLLVLILSLGTFIFLKVRKDPDGDEWGQNELYH
ncbi:MAG: hypothetical protein DRI46_11025 [Chloroflexi bacterium]|nr:MAG: hypothetical protein DRI46_11025 [Chloroflexota bacterium]